MEVHCCSYTRACCAARRYTATTHQTIKSVGYDSSNKAFLEQVERLNNPLINSRGETLHLHPLFVLVALQGCPEIITYYGDHRIFGCDYSYPLFFKPASGRNLLDLIWNSDLGSLSETQVRRNTRMILNGIFHIHQSGYVHCNLETRNIVVFPTENKLKITGFEQAVREVKRQNLYPDRELSCPGEARYKSPEAIAFENHREKPMDIWSLGCIIIEMISGKPCWDHEEDMDLLFELAFGEEIPDIPTDKLSKDGVDFVYHCLQRDVDLRWTAEMLLNHPFVADIEADNHIDAAGERD